jgi:hypothetical protein
MSIIGMQMRRALCNNFFFSFVFGFIGFLFCVFVLCREFAYIVDASTAISFTSIGRRETWKRLSCCIISTLLIRYCSQRLDITCWWLISMRSEINWVCSRLVSLVLKIIFVHFILQSLKC